MPCIWVMIEEGEIEEDREVREEGEKENQPTSTRRERGAL